MQRKSKGELLSLRSGFGTEWTAEKLDRLRELWAQGKSASEIGRLLGVSKNSVCGKAHRLGLPGRASPIKCGGLPWRRSHRRAVPVGAALAVPRPVPAPVPMAAPMPAPVGKVGRCAWPMWGNVRPREPVFCCEPTTPDRPYCPLHCRIGYRQVPLLTEAAD